ncbi:MAG: SCO family protein [Gemmatimonadaceae bacterium]|nr:SCO family protein [Gemmatimonadaceae bacterium]
MKQDVSRPTRKIVAGFALAIAACAPKPDAGPPEGAINPFDGSTPMAVTLVRPRFTLTDTDGKPFAFAERTAGTATFLLFGYTNCPDVCPVNIANLAAALHKLPFDVRSRARVVFVSVDPDRDSLPAIRKWLDAFDTSFIGLRGNAATVDSIQLALGLGPALRSPPDAKGGYEVGHAAPVIAFAPDDTARALYPFGTRQSDWLTAIPKVLKNQ